MGTQESANNDKQCRICEQFQDRRVAGLAGPDPISLSMEQRNQARVDRVWVGSIREPIPTKSGPSSIYRTMRGTVYFLGRQFAHLTDQERLALIRLKAEHVSDRTREMLRRLPAGHLILTKIGPIEPFLSRLRTNAEFEVFRRVPAGGFPR